jgi:hypothetical protein
VPVITTGATVGYGRHFFADQKSIDKISEIFYNENPEIFYNENVKSNFFFKKHFDLERSLRL